MFSRLLDRLEARVGRHKGIRNLMTVIAIGTVITYFADMILPMVMGRSLSSYLVFSKSAIMRGEIWRLITFVFVPIESSSLLLLAISLFFYWMMGQHLQNNWGTFRFTLFYTVGMLGSVISGCITGYATAYYLNLSLMLAVAIIHPNMTMRLYGILELRMKWFALISLAMMLLPFLQGFGTWKQAVAIAVALLNVLLFFMDGLIGQIKDAYRRYTWRRNWRSGWKR